LVVFLLRRWLTRCQVVWSSAPPVDEEADFKRLFPSYHDEFDHENAEDARKDDAVSSSPVETAVRIDGDFVAKFIRLYAKDERQHEQQRWMAFRAGYEAERGSSDVGANLAMLGASLSDLNE